MPKEQKPRRKLRKAGAGGSANKATVRLGAGSTAVLRGNDDVTTWDDEELARGRRRDSGGHFRGRDPVLVPRAVHNEFLRRTLVQVERIITQSGIPAAETLLDLVQNEPADAAAAAVQLKAAQEVLNRLLGRAPEKAEITITERPWDRAMAAAIVASDDQVIDVEPVR